MKKVSVQNKFIRMLMIIIACLFLTNCEKKENNLAPDNWLDRSYLGTLTVHYTSVYPQWDVSTQMDVDIDKELGAVTISGSTLNYSGETLVSDDSKIERSGSWSINPIGRLEGSSDNPIVFVDAQIFLQNDVQNIYAKDTNGNWVLVNSSDFSGEEPNSDLGFNFDDAILTGAVINAQGAGGSITWTLRLTPALD